MSTQKRCVVIVRVTVMPDNKVVRAICDRPKGHPGWEHKGRLIIGEDVWGTIEWPRAQPK